MRYLTARFDGNLRGGFPQVASCDVCAGLSDGGGHTEAHQRRRGRDGDGHVVTAGTGDTHRIASVDGDQAHAFAQAYNGIAPVEPVQVEEWQTGL